MCKHPLVFRILTLSYLSAKIKCGRQKIKGWLIRSQSITFNFQKTRFYNNHIDYIAVTLLVLINSEKGCFGGLAMNNLKVVKVSDNLMLPWTGTLSRPLLAIFVLDYLYCNFTYHLGIYLMHSLTVTHSLEKKFTWLATYFSSRKCLYLIQGGYSLAGTATYVGLAKYCIMVAQTYWVKKDCQNNYLLK